MIFATRTRARYIYMQSLHLVYLWHCKEFILEILTKAIAILHQSCRMNLSKQQMHRQNIMDKNRSELLAACALQAVKIRKQCGRYVAAQYARKHGVSSLYRLALQLAAVQGF